MDWGTLLSTFGLVFVAELGDKTQLAVLSLAGRHSTPWIVFAGGTLALTLVTALGVVGGEGLCRIIPTHSALGLGHGFRRDGVVDGIRRSVDFIGYERGNA
jgi:putative Ca2+/H+ antiporter (TMEM165/GDT1 family)